MGRPTKEIRSGKVKLTLWEGDYQGKPTYSYSMKKSEFKDGNWKDSDFYNQNDLYDLRNLIDKALVSKIKVREIQLNNNQPPQQPPAQTYQNPSGGNNYQAPQSFEDDSIPF